MQPPYAPASPQQPAPKVGQKNYPNIERFNEQIESGGPPLPKATDLESDEAQIANLQKQIDNLDMAHEELWNDVISGRSPLERTKSEEESGEQSCTHCEKMTSGWCSACKKPVCSACWPISRDYHKDRGESATFMSRYEEEGIDYKRCDYCGELLDPIEEWHWHQGKKYYGHSKGEEGRWDVESKRLSKIKPCPQCETLREALRLNPSSLMADDMLKEHLATHGLKPEEEEGIGGWTFDCPKCNGTGMVGDAECDKCDGTGGVYESGKHYKPEERQNAWCYRHDKTVNEHNDDELDEDEEKETTRYEEGRWDFVEPDEPEDGGRPSTSQDPEKKKKRQRQVGEGQLKNLTDKEFEEMRYVWYLNPMNDEDYFASSDGRTRKEWARDKAYDDFLNRDEIQEILEAEDPSLWGLEEEPDPSNPDRELNPDPDIPEPVKPTEDNSHNKDNELITTDGLDVPDKVEIPERLYNDLMMMIEYSVTNDNEAGGFLIKAKHGDLGVVGEQFGKDREIVLEPNEQLHEGEELVGTVHMHPVTPTASTGDVAGYLNDENEKVMVVVGADKSINVFFKTSFTAEGDYGDEISDNFEQSDMGMLAEGLGFIWYRAEESDRTVLNIITNVVDDVELNVVDETWPIEDLVKALGIKGRPDIPESYSTKKQPLKLQIPFSWKCNERRLI